MIRLRETSAGCITSGARLLDKNFLRRNAWREFDTISESFSAVFQGAWSSPLLTVFVVRTTDVRVATVSGLRNLPLLMLESARRAVQKKTCTSTTAMIQEKSEVYSVETATRRWGS